jgi:hypothetical protein
MKRILFPLLALLLSHSLVAWPFSLRGNGFVKSEERRVPAFHAIDMSGVGELRIERGTAFSVKVTLDSNLLSSYETRVEGGVLRLGFEQGKTVSGLTRLEVKVTMPALDALGLSGAARAELADRFAGDTLELDLSGTGQFTGRIDYGRLEAGISGAGRLDLEGEADKLRLDISGTGRFEADGLQVREAEIGISGAGSATLRVESSLEADISGTGSVRYYGDPRVSQRVSGVGRISRLGG